nr:MAG TPA: hypothetical protein [Caudoviricetes sp.]
MTFCRPEETRQEKKKLIFIFIREFSCGRP